MTDILIKVLEEGEKAVTAWGNSFAVRRPNGELLIYTLEESEEGIPRLGPNRIVITHGRGEVEVRKPKKKRNSSSSKDQSLEEDDGVVYGSF